MIKAIKPDGPKRMMSVETREDGHKTVYINPSSLTLLQTCPRKSYYQLARNLVSRDSAPALTFGTAIHRALEIYYTGAREERVLPNKFKENIMLMCHGQTLPDESSSILYRATRGFIECAEPLTNLPDSDKRSIANGGWLLGEYFESRVFDPYEILVLNGKPQVEQLLETSVFTSPMLDINLFGTVDAILQNQSTGQIVVCDHKTSSIVGNDFYNRTKPNHQYTAYVLLAQQALGLTTDNFMINCFQVKARPKTARGTGPNFLHLITKRTPEDIEEFILSLTYYVGEYLGWLESGFFPYGPVDACANYGKCNFLDVCSAPSNIKENILTANYKDKYETQ